MIYNIKIKLLLFLGLISFGLIAHDSVVIGSSPDTKSSFLVGQIQYNGGNWNARPNSIRPFINYLVSRTSIQGEFGQKALKADSKDIFSYPFLIWIGNQEFSSFSEKEIENLRNYLRFGGFIFVEDSQGSQGFGFDKSVRREFKRIFPNKKLRSLPEDHTIYRSFYLLNRAYGRTNTNEDILGIDVQGRTVLVYSQNDLFGAISKDSFGNWEFEISHNNQKVRKYSYRLAVNIVMYALCDDYKKDALHVDYILKRRRLP